MNTNSEATLHPNSMMSNVTGWLAGIFFFAIGEINVVWGNDLYFGIFIVMLSLVYIPPLNTIFEKKTRLSIPWFVKVLLGLFILWAALGVGELFGKIDLMMDDL